MAELILYDKDSEWGAHPKQRRVVSKIVVGDEDIDDPSSCAFGISIHIESTEDETDSITFALNLENAESMAEFMLTKIKQLKSYHISQGKSGYGEEILKPLDSDNPNLSA